MLYLEYSVVFVVEGCCNWRIPRSYLEHSTVFRVDQTCNQRVPRFCLQYSVVFGVLCCISSDPMLYSE